MKQLEEQVKTLGERLAKESTEATSCSSCFNCNFGHHQLPAEVKARVLNKHVLIRVHCENSKGIVEEILQQIGKLHLSAASRSTMPFGDHALEATIIAQMKDEFCLTVEDIVTNLRQTLQSI
ncbi:hypothetical protein Ancab_026179 [Ancistrocladus abbreviatus]